MSLVVFFAFFLLLSFPLCWGRVGICSFFLTCIWLYSWPLANNTCCKLLILCYFSLFRCKIFFSKWWVTIVMKLSFMYFPLGSFLFYFLSSCAAIEVSDYVRVYHLKKYPSLLYIIILPGFLMNIEQIINWTWKWVIMAFKLLMISKACLMNYLVHWTLQL